MFGYNLRQEIRMSRITVGFCAGDPDVLQLPEVWEFQRVPTQD